MDLYSYFLTQSGNSIIKNAHYFAIYERYFEKFKGEAVLIFEIGTGEGGSAKMWKTYFGPLARIVTVDIRDCSHIAETQIYVRTGSQSDPLFLKSLVEDFGRPDIVIDDGSHMMNDIMVSFDTLYPLMSPRGIYLVEDLNTAYWPQHGGGLGASRSFIERCKTLVDEIHARHALGAVAETPAGQQTFGVSFYDMLVVLEKTPFANRDLIKRP